MDLKPINPGIKYPISLDPEDGTPDTLHYNMSAWRKILELMQFMDIKIKSGWNFNDGAIIPEDVCLKMAKAIEAVSKLESFWWLYRDEILWEHSGGFYVY